MTCLCVHVCVHVCANALYSYIHIIDPLVTTPLKKLVWPLATYIYGPTAALSMYNNKMLFYSRVGYYVEGGREGSYEVGKQSAMGERSEDGFGGFWVARIRHTSIEWTIDE